jgi:hypothetical protein
MQHLLPVPVKRLHIAADRLPADRSRNGTDRALWIAARNYKSDEQAQPDDTPDVVRLPHFIAERIAELTPEHEDTKGTEDNGNAET